MPPPLGPRKDICTAWVSVHGLTPPAACTYTRAVRANQMQYASEGLRDAIEDKVREKVKTIEIDHDDPCSHENLTRMSHT
jgi:hypothetical protein